MSKLNSGSISQNPDVRFLGRLLGDVIRDYAGEKLFQQIEAIRSASVERHRGRLPKGSKDQGLGALSLDETLAFTRSFMLFSMLANLAEDRQGISQEAGATMADALKKLQSASVSREQVDALLQTALVVPVLTAHPTEVRRKSMIDHWNAIADLMRQRDAGRENSDHGELIEDALRRRIALLWQTRPLRHERLYVADEVETALSYMRDSFLPVVPPLYDRWARELDWRPPSFLRIGSWIGGDRDGNPFVNAESLNLALSSACRTLLEFYLDEIHALGAELSISSELAPVTQSLSALARHSHDDGAARVDEPYRQAVRGVYARLARTYQTLMGVLPPRPTTLESSRYDTAEDLRQDLLTIAESLRSGGHDELVHGRLENLIRATEVFGFYLATLDLRQNSAVHERVVGELLRAAGAHPDYSSLSEQRRVDVLRGELIGARLLLNPFADYSDETRSELAIVRAAADAHARYGANSITAYVISKAESVSDLLEVYVLLKEVGLWTPGQNPSATIMAVPLFETIGDLEQAAAVMTAFFEQPEIAALTARRGYQEVMVGYSDSNKDGGYFTSVWSLHQSSQELAEVFQKTGTTMQLFHGRGGAVGRGGGSSFSAIRAQPAGTVQGRIRITEQGEVIAAKYGSQQSAEQNLEAMAAATLLASLKPRSLANRSRFSTAAARISDAAFRTYRSLVYDTEGFNRVFRQMTPIAEIGQLKIGSRPASRTKSDRIEDLRAIPWVFSWAQSRVMLPGWFGVGSGLAAIGDHEVLREMYASWPFLQSTLANLEMVLAKSDLSIAALYAELVDDRPLAQQIFGRIADEWQVTHDLLLTITGQTRLLEHKPALDASIRLRLPYIEPLNLIQIELLKRHRAGEKDPRISEAIQLSINAIATALRNSG